MKVLINYIKRIYRIWIILGFVALFLTLRFVPGGFIPDYFDLNSKIQDRGLIMAFLTSLIGFFSLVIAVFIVFFNLFSNSIRRNAVDFIIKNTWLQYFLSCYFGLIVFLLLSFLSLKFPLDNNGLNLIYADIFLFLSFILLAFPIILKSLDHSLSLKRIREMVNEISIDHLRNITNRESKTNDFSSHLQSIESNNLIQLKDLGKEGIGRGDWTLPQNILLECYSYLINPISQEMSENERVIRVTAFQFLLDHFIPEAARKKDIITLRVLSSFLTKTHFDLLNKSLRLGEFKSILETSERFFEVLIEIDRPELNRLVQDDSNEIASINISHLKINDKDLSLPRYSYDQVDSFQAGDADYNVQRIWFDVVNNCTLLFFNAMEYAIERGNRRVYSSFDLNTHIMINKIARMKNLSDYQKEEIIEKYFTSGDYLISVLIDKEMYNGESVHSESQIFDWYRDKKLFASSGLRSYTYFVKTIIEKKNLMPNVLKDYFRLGRTLINLDFDEEMEKALEQIYSTIRFILEQTELSSRSISSQRMEFELNLQQAWLKETVENNGSRPVKALFKKHLGKMHVKKLSFYLS